MNGQIYINKLKNYLIKSEQYPTNIKNTINLDNGSENMSHITDQLKTNLVKIPCYDT